MPRRFAPAVLLLFACAAPSLSCGSVLARVVEGSAIVGAGPRLRLTPEEERWLKAQGRIKYSLKVHTSCGNLSALAACDQQHASFSMEASRQTPALLALPHPAGACVRRVSGPGSLLGRARRRVVLP